MLSTVKVHTFACLPTAGNNIIIKWKENYLTVDFIFIVHSKSYTVLILTISLSSLVQCITKHTDEGTYDKKCGLHLDSQKTWQENIVPLPMPVTLPSNYRVRREDVM
jgi:hypothetical protein